MQTKTMGFCRYSVITHDGGAWKVGKNQAWDDYRGHAISFPFGYKAWFDHAAGSYTRVAEHWQPKIALGLAYVGHRRDKTQHVFQAGGHNQVDRRSPLFTLPAGPMYLHTFHQDNDVLSVVKNPKQLANSVEQRFAEGEPVALAGLDEHFSLALEAAPSKEFILIQGVK